MKVEFTLGIGFANAKHREIFDIDDDATDEDIEAQLQEWANNYIDTGWKKV